MAVELDIPTIEDIQQLCSDTLVVSMMPDISSDIQETDVLTFATNSGISSTNLNIEKRYFDGQITDWVLNGDLDITGKWEFAVKNSSGLSIETSCITNAVSCQNLSVVVNSNYLNNVYLREIENFRNYIYRAPHVPSLVGDVIFSTTLTTSVDVARIYGGTKWNLIGNGTMILGDGPCEANNMTKYGNCSSGEVNFTEKSTRDYLSGANKVELKPENIPNHNHKFIGGSASGHFGWSYGGSSQQPASTDAVNQKGKNARISGYYVGKVSALAGGIKIRGETGVSSAKLFGRSRSLDSTIFSSSGTEQTQESHNNVPPVMFAYIWQREA